MKFLLLQDIQTAEDRKHNLKLSQKRAEYVRTLILNKLEYQGFNIENYTIVPIGLANIAPNIPDAQTEIEHDQNRRVSLFLLKENSRVATILKEKFPKWKEYAEKLNSESGK